jgi:EAL domain-containing protein (putative c-di-GMP-specific phosphodiesterase class I)
MAAAPDLAGKLVFEIATRDVALLGNAGRAGLGELVGLGFALSLDGLVPGDEAAHALPGVRFAKIHADMLMAAGLGAVVEQREAGVEPIALRVETELQATAVARLGVRLAQGYLFGRPQATRLAKAA